MHRHRISSRGVHNLGVMIMTRRNLQENLQTQTRNASRLATHQPWIERLARFGLASKGVVYAIVGILAAQAAFGAGGRTTDTEGALQTIVAQPLGKFLLSLIAIGLIGYVLWRWVQAVKDPEGKGTDGKGLLQRLGEAINGFIYAGLAMSAVRLALGTGGGSDRNATQDWTARLLAQPFGQGLVAIAGVLIIGLGFYEIYQAFTTKFRKKLKWHEMSPTEQNAATQVGRLGKTARGIVFAITGFFLIQAARQSDPSQARGLGGALAALAAQPYGPWLLGLVAIGLIAYGLYMGVEAKYRRIFAH